MKPEGVLVIFLHHGKAKAYLAELRLYGFRAENWKELEGLDSSILDPLFEVGIRFRYREIRWY